MTRVWRFFFFYNNIIILFYRSKAVFTILRVIMILHYSLVSRQRLAIDRKTSIAYGASLYRRIVYSAPAPPHDFSIYEKKNRKSYTKESESSNKSIRSPQSTEQRQALITMLSPYNCSESYTTRHYRVVVDRRELTGVRDTSHYLPRAFFATSAV